MFRMMFNRRTLLSISFVVLLVVGVFCFFVWKQRVPTETDVGNSPVGGDVDTMQQKSFSSKGDSAGRNETASDIQRVQLNRSDTRLDEERLTAADKAERDQMLTKFFPLATKSESDIIRILVDFYPEEARIEGLQEFYTRKYRNYDADDTVEDKVRKLVAITQEFLATYRRMEEEVNEAVKQSTELRRRDPVKYYELLIQEAKDEIPVTEAKLRDAEARGDQRMIEEYRESLSFLHEKIRSSETSRAYHAWQNGDDLGAKARLVELLKANGYSVSPAAVMSYELPKPSESEPSESLPTETVVAPSESSSPLSNEVSVSPSSGFNPVRSLTAAQQSLKSWRVDLDGKYFDVVVSQDMTPAELDKYFPKPSDRELLKSRTTEMQKAVVSKIRTLVSDIPNATATQKRELTRDLVRQNFDKDFADEVLSELEKDAE